MYILSAVEDEEEWKAQTADSKGLCIHPKTLRFASSMLTSSGDLLSQDPCTRVETTTRRGRVECGPSVSGLSLLPALIQSEDQQRHFVCLQMILRPLRPPNPLFLQPIAHLELHLVRLVA